MPCFTIATITLNNLDGLKRTHASIDAQNCKDYEWLVQDGGSKDTSAEYLKHTSAKTISEQDSGIYNAMNRLIERAQGDYIIFMNAGDTFADVQTLELLQQTIKESTPDFIYGDALEDIKNGVTYKKSRAHSAAKYGMFTHHQSMIYKRDALSDLRYNESYKIAADYCFTCRAIEKSKHIIYVPAPLCIFESGGISQQKSKLGREEQFQIRKDLKLCSPFENIAIKLAQSINWQFRLRAPRLYWLLKR